MRRSPDAWDAVTCNLFRCCAAIAVLCQCHPASMWFYILLGYLAATAFFLATPLLQRTNKLAGLLGLVVLSPWFLVTLSADRALGLAALVLPWPLNGDDIVKRPQRFFTTLKSSPFSRMPRDARLVKVTPAGSIDAEPGKDKMANKFTVTFQVGGGAEQSINVFVKATSERAVHLLLKVYGSVLTAETREGGLYRRVQSGLLKLPLSVPPLLHESWSRWFHKSFVVLELMPETHATRPDWMAIGVAHAEAIIDDIARMHAKYWRCSANIYSPEDVSFVYYGPGLSWISFVELWLKPGKSPAWATTLWAALRKHFDADPRMTFSHGDCRPGNLLFSAAGASSGKSNSGMNVTFTDWEACAVTPVMWDCYYMLVMGLPVDVRRASQPALLARYQSVLLRHGVPAADCTLPQLDTDCLLLGLVLSFYGWGLVHAQGVGEVQGNSKEDCNAWGERLRAARLDAQPRAEEVCKLLGVPRTALDPCFSDESWNF